MSPKNAITRDAHRIAESLDLFLNLSLLVLVFSYYRAAGKSACGKLPVALVCPSHMYKCVLTAQGSVCQV